MHPVCLSNRSFCTCSNSRKYSSDIVKFIYVVHIGYGINWRENDIYGTKGSSTEKHKIFWYIKAYGEKILKAYFNILPEM